MTTYQTLLLLWLLGAIQGLAFSATDNSRNRYRFILSDELIIACFWPVTLIAVIYKEWRRTRHFPSRW